MLRACGRHFSRPAIEWRTPDERQESRTSYQTEPWLQCVVRDVDRLRVLPSGSGNREEERKYVRVNQKMPERGGSVTRLPSRSLASHYEMNPRTGEAPWIRPMCKGMELSLTSRRGTIEIEQVVLGNLATHATTAATRLVRRCPMCVLCGAARSPRARARTITSQEHVTHLALHTLLIGLLCRDQRTNRHRYTG